MGQYTVGILAMFTRQRLGVDWSEMKCSGRSGPAAAGGGATGELGKWVVLGGDGGNLGTFKPTSLLPRLNREVHIRKIYIISFLNKMNNKWNIGNQTNKDFF